MAREAKMGLMFIGVLLTVFCALLMKRLTKHSNFPPLNLNATAKGTDFGSFSHMPSQPVPPTLVTPQDDNSRPPEFAMNNREGLKQNAGSLWNSPAPRPWQAEATSRDHDSLPSSSQPPSLLAEPLPVADGNRYAARTPDESGSRLQADANRQRDAAERSDTPVPYHSGYSTASDDTRPTPTPAARQPQPEAAADPFPRVTALEAQPHADYTAGSEQPKSHWQENASPAGDIVRTENPLVNGLRSMPTNMAAAAPAATTSAGMASAGDERYSPPEPRVASRNSNPVTEFTPRTVPTNEYLPRSNTAGDFSQRDSAVGDFTSRGAASGVVPTSTVPPAGIQRDGDQYSVQPNDSFWIISEKAYGSGGFFKALFELNRKRTKDSEDLKVGEVLAVPDEAVLRRMYPDLCPKPRKQVASLQQRMVSANSRLQGAGRVYTVVDGDTLFEIARHELGKPARWGEIYELNREVLGDDFDYLRPGTELILPDHPGGTADLHGNTATRQPDSFYPR